MATAVGLGVTRSAASVGIGAAGVLARRIGFDVDVARALVSAGATREGDVRLESRVSVSF